MSNTTHANIWKILDDADFTEEYGAGASGKYGCDSCGDAIEVMPMHSHRLLNIDLCDACYLSGDYNDKIWKVESIDRLSQSIEEKPLRWPCATCGIKMGGGHSWMLIQNKNDTYTGGIDVCLPCFEKYGLEGVINHHCPVEHIEDDTHIFVSERCNPLPVFAGPVQSLRSVPIAIADKLTEEMANIWVESATHSLGHLDPSCMKFGSVRQWCLFTESYDVPEGGGIETALAFDSVTGRVASVLWDNHGRMGVDVVFQNFAEYEQAESEWRNNQSSLEKQRQTILDDCKKSRRGDIEDSDVALLCTEFSGYIRIHLELGTYYG